ncbi:MAG: fused MFS/spermidine synthase [Dehalococcoidia bacterium]
MSAAMARLLVFGSSAAVLVLEILAGRLMAPYVGISLEAFTGIIGIVLLGIALGAWTGGRVADLVDPRPLIGPLLVASGLLTVVAPPTVDLVGPYMRAAGPVEIVLLTTSAFLLPSLTLSAIPSLVVKLRLRSLDETGTIVGSLSALSTIGALAGTFLTGFVFVAAAPTRPLVVGMGVLLVAAGIAFTARSASRSTVAAAIIGGVLAVGTLAATPGPCEHYTAYYCAVIEDDPEHPGGRVLRLDTLRHSYVDLDDPTHLEFRYTQTMADVVAELPVGPLHAAYIGGGGFTLPRYVEAVRPGSTATVLEIDGPLVALVERELGLDLDDSLRAEVGDARLLLPDFEAGSLDLVVGDAFGGVSVPWHLTTREFLHEVDRVLADDGVYLVNVIDYPPLDFARAEVATFLEVFPHVAVVAPERYLEGTRGGNFVVVGARQPLRWDVVQDRLDERGAGEVARADAEAAAFAGDAAVLRDDFAPVDQLLGRP